MRTENHPTGGRTVTISVYFDRSDLVIAKTPFGVIITLEGLKSGGKPGAPSLPRTQLRIAVPPPLWPGSLHIGTEKWEPVSDAATLVVPAQNLRPGGGVGGGDKENHCATKCSCHVPQHPDRAPLNRGFLPPEITAPDPKAYAEAIENPPPVTRAARIESIGSTNIAVVDMAPVRFGPKGELELCTFVQVEIVTVDEPCFADRKDAVAEAKKRFGKSFDESRVIPQPEPFISGLAEATRLRDIAMSHVINPALVGRVRVDWPIIELPSDYLIITDDVTWDAATITSGLGRPGIVAAFERLAEAKRARGITARVATITDIVSSRWGDFRTGSRDLQEVIRRFLKAVRRRWGVNWLLLGGDTSIVPVRRVAGPVRGEIRLGTTNPPGANASYWTGTYLRANTPADNNNRYWPDTTNLLVRADTGVLIPYDAAGTSSSTSPGWFFTTTDNYETRSAIPTSFVRVEGPSSLINAELRFLFDTNILPTDFYYASLSSWVNVTLTLNSDTFGFSKSFVYTPRHDWDALDNGIYGQSDVSGTDLDGVIMQTDISVGRAPVDSAEEAKTFVDKTLAYERLGKVLWRTANRNWPRKMLLAASDWDSRALFWSTTSPSPANYRYFHDAAQSRSVLKLDGPPGSFDFAVISRITMEDRRLMPYKRTTSTSVRGWYFATSATDMTPRQQTIFLPSGRIVWPLPSEWIVVHGSLEERTPQNFEWNPTGQQASMSDQELLRKQIRSEIPGIDTFDRYYEDEFDLPTADRIEAPVDYLSTSKLVSGLNAAPHIVSLSGHGDWYGCCELWTAGAAGLTNGPLGFIAYADSCLTSSFDSEDCMGEELIKNPNGGAVAYVGNTRFSWIDVGDNFQRAFFHRLTATRHLGLLNDSRLLVPGTTGYWYPYERWTVFALTLLGDPELRVYRGPLPPLGLSLDKVRLEKPVIRVVVRGVPGVPPRPGPVKGVLVHVRQGKQEFKGRTDGEGAVQLPEGVFGKGELEVTVSHDEYAVGVEVVRLEG